MKTSTVVLVVVSLCLTSCEMFTGVFKPKPPPSQFPACSELSIEGIVITKDDFELAGLTLGKYALGKLAYKRDPKFETIYSQATRDAIVEDCLFRFAIKSGDIDPTDMRQRDYLKALTHFLRLPHTAEEFIAFRKNSAFPGSVRTENPYEGMVEVPAGDFIMGSSQQETDKVFEEFKEKHKRLKPWWLEDEFPKRRVSLGKFWIDKYEITNGQYAAFLDSSEGKGFQAPQTWVEGKFPGGKGNHPVTGLNKTEGTAYCLSRGKRLPNEQQWEKAARGPTGRIYPWGQDSHSQEIIEGKIRVNTVESGSRDTSELGVMTDDVSHYGVYDMAGNAMEWVADGYGPYPGAGPTGETKRTFDEHPGPGFGIARGASYDSFLFDARGASRRYFGSAHRGKDIGFRCVAD